MTTKTAKTTMRKSCKNWYMQNFPEDSLGREINPKLTFKMLLDILKKGDDVYAALGNAADSVIRESLFMGLSEISGISLSDIFEMWHQGGELFTFYKLPRDCYGQPSGCIEEVRMSRKEFEERRRYEYLYDDYYAACCRAQD